ncbi:sigma-70 family RNA polymerase sigma factor [Synechococcales cyanobacterium C]|uniref:Sigma-70 family RNA polymerase sigma factor n=1 Tax=Petrachloros mirabilis ULC683 TaxID=2781853 RepID=A0A8K2A7L1_9CYAN|nr:RNA polymerase sigma factor SigF [Petrachloros mirabilis]NCJ06309.1 sigma-70 family RNA polymerase sigma factor [Petrachloros mirabilis ULC683]
MPVTLAKDVKHDSLQLLQQYQQCPHTDLRNKLVHLNLGLVRKEAHHWIGHTTESFEDLMQVGTLGLIRAIERFDPCKGNAFSTFAIPYIRGEIQHYLRDKSPQVRIPRRWQQIQRQAAEVTRAVQAQHHRLPTDAELAAALDISQAEWQDVKLSVRNRSLLSLDAPMQTDDSESSSLGDLLPDRQYRSFQLAQEDQVRIQEALAKLEKRTSEVLEFVFFYDLTQKETAERLGISAVTVSRQVKKGLIALKQILTRVEEAPELDAMPPTQQL